MNFHRIPITFQSHSNYLSIAFQLLSNWFQTWIQLHSNNLPIAILSHCNCIPIASQLHPNRFQLPSNCFPITFQFVSKFPIGFNCIPITFQSLSYLFPTALTTDNRYKLPYAPLNATIIATKNCQNFSKMPPQKKIIIIAINCQICKCCHTFLQVPKTAQKLPNVAVIRQLL